MSKPAPVLDDEIQDARAEADAQLRMHILQFCREAARRGEARRLLLDAGIESALPRQHPTWPLVHVLCEMERRGDLADYGATLAACLAIGNHEAGFASAAMDEADKLPATTQLPWYIGQVLETLAKRRAAEDLAELVKECLNGTPPAEVLERMKSIAGRLESTGAGVEPLETFDLSAEPPPTPGPLVGNDTAQIIMPREATALASDPGIGKTKTVTEIALGVSSGTTALGFPCQQQPVVYVSSDGDPELFRNINRQWAARGPGAGRLADLPLFIASDDAFVLDDAGCRARLVKTLQKASADKGPALCIVESLATNAIEPEDLIDQVRCRLLVNRTVRALMRSFPGLTVIMSCHLRKIASGGKSGNDLPSRVAGSMQIRGAFDCVHGLVASGRDAFAVRRIKRSRSGGDFEPFRVSIKGTRHEPLVLTNEGPENIAIEEARGAARAIIDHLKAIGGGSIALKTIAAKLAPNFRLRAVQDAAKRLSEAETPALVRTSKMPAAYALVDGHDGLDL